MCAEHIKFSGMSCHLVITAIFNAMSTFECIPHVLKRGIIIPIPKGDKDRNLQDNYRGITLLPVLGKMYQTVLLHKIRSWVRSNKIIEDVQGANQDHCSSLHTNWIVREAIMCTL